MIDSASYSVASVSVDDGDDYSDEKDYDDEEREDEKHLEHVQNDSLKDIIDKHDLI